MTRNKIPLQHEALFDIVKGMAKLFAAYHGIPVPEFTSDEVPKCANCQKEMPLCMCDDCKTKLLGENTHERDT